MPPLPPTPEKPYSNGRHLLNLVFLSALVVLAAIDVYILYRVGDLIVFAYSGSNDPTSVNGLVFPIAMITLVIYGAPAGTVTFLAALGYYKTRPPKPVARPDPGPVITQPPAATQP